MKRFAAVLLALCMLFSVSGLAAEGDMVFAAGDGQTLSGPVDAMLANGEELVLNDYNALYTWRKGEEDLHVYKWAEENSSTGVDPNTGEELLSMRIALAYFAQDGTVYAVLGDVENRGMNSEFLGATLNRIVLDGDTAHYEQVSDSEIDWAPLTTQSEYGSSPNILTYPILMDNTLYGLAYDGDSGTACYSVPLDGSYAKEIEGFETCYNLVGAKDGKLLGVFTNENSAESLLLMSWDPQTEEMEEVLDIAIDPNGGNYPMGFVYDADADALYYIAGSSVNALNLQTAQVQQVNDVPGVNEINAKACLLPGGTYVFSCFDKTVVRSTNADGQTKRRLAIYNSYMNEIIDSAQNDFMNKHGDVSVSATFNTQDTDRIVNDLLTQSTDYDIYILPASSSVFDAVYKRGYAAQLSGSETIDKFFDEMYPSLAQRLCTDGKPVAIPLAVDGTGLGVSSAALARAGLSIDEIPTNWVDFLEKLPALQEQLSDTGVTLFDESFTQGYLKGILVNQILKDYGSYMAQVDPLMGYDTDVLRNALQKLEELDYASLGLQEDEDDFMPNLFTDEETVLFHDTVGYTLRNYYDGIEPLCLAMSPDTEPVLSLETVVGFVNPYSENADLAIAFLETALEHLDKAVYGTLCDVEITPAHTAAYAEAKAAAQQDLEALQETAASAEEGDKQSLDEMIAQAQARLESVENGYWDVRSEAIAWYRAHDDSIIISTYNPLYGGNADEEISDSLNRFIDGEIGAAEMLQKINGKLQMMILEGN